MAKFFVGQRVSIVRAENHAHLQGAECRITGRARGFCPVKRKWFLGWKLDVVGWNGLMCVAEEYQIEPILDRHEPCEAEFKATLDELLSREAKPDALVPLPQQSET